MQKDIKRLFLRKLSDLAKILLSKFSSKYMPFLKYDTFLANNWFKKCIKL